jgi:hypothetical protein
MDIKGVFSFFEILEKKGKFSIINIGHFCFVSELWGSERRPAPGRGQIIGQLAPIQLPGKTKQTLLIENFQNFQTD